MNLTRLVLHRFDPEFIHDLTINICKSVGRSGLLVDLIDRVYNDNSRDLSIKLGNLDFPNPIGLAAGFDKDGVAVNVLQALGFGFVEVGTITPKPQGGNPKPRLFRLKKDSAVINRMGFNNKGLNHLVSNFNSIEKKVPIGINLGKNKNTPLDQAAQDYLEGLTKCWELGDYFVINISSPNTENLRDIQNENNLKPFLEQVISKRVELSDQYGSYKQIWLKIAPDMNDDDLKSVCDLVGSGGLDAMIVSNTTITRPLTHSAYKNETGGLSGKPLFDLSNEVLHKAKELTEGKIPLIAVGGIFSASDVIKKMKLGASLVQLYTSLIYGGPGLIRNIKQSLVKDMADQFSEVS